MAAGVRRPHIERHQEKYAAGRGGAAATRPGEGHQQPMGAGDRQLRNEPRPVRGREGREPPEVVHDI